MSLNPISADAVFSGAAILNDPDFGLTSGLSGNSIEFVERYKVYNFEVARHHTYIADGIRVHNTSVLSFLDANDLQHADFSSMKLDADGAPIAINIRYPDGSGARQIKVVNENGEFKQAEFRHTSINEETGYLVQEIRIEDENGNVLLKEDGTPNVEYVDLVAGQYGEEAGRAITPYLTTLLLGEDLNVFERVLGNTIIGTTIENTLEAGFSLFQAWIDVRTGVLGQEIVSQTFQDIEQELQVNFVEYSVQGLNSLIMSEVFGFLDGENFAEDLAQGLISQGVDYFLNASIFELGTDVFDISEDVLVSWGISETDPSGISSIFSQANITLLVFNTALRRILPEIETIEGLIAQGASAAILTTHFAKALASGGLAALGPAGIIGVGAWIVGKIFDSIFEKNPEAFTSVYFDYETSRFGVGETTENDGGNTEASIGTAELFVEFLNNIMGATVSDGAIESTDIFAELAEELVFVFGHYEEQIQNGSTRIFDSFSDALSAKALDVAGFLEVDPTSDSGKAILEVQDDISLRDDLFEAGRTSVFDSLYINATVNLQPEVINAVVLPKIEAYIEVNPEAVRGLSNEGLIGRLQALGIALTEDPRLSVIGLVNSLYEDIHMSSYDDDSALAAVLSRLFSEDGHERLLTTREVTIRLAEREDYTEASKTVNDKYSAFDILGDIYLIRTVISFLDENALPTSSFSELVDGVSSTGLKIASEASLYAQLKHNLAIASNFKEYLSDREYYDNIIAASPPNSPYVQGWFLTFDEAYRLGFADAFVSKEWDPSQESSGGAGDDSLIGDGADNKIVGLDGNDQIDGGDGDDLQDGGAGNDLLIGGNGDDTLIGKAGDDTLVGNAGDDLLQGGDGSDELLGGTGNDTLEGGSGGDLLAGGEGDDVLSGQDGNDTLYGEGNIGSVPGVPFQQGDDWISGGNGDDSILGGIGADTLTGDEGNDTLDGEGGADQLSGGVGSDDLSGGAGNDLLAGNSGDDNLVGGAGSDTLEGGDGADTLIADGGTDSLLGGSGDDLYLITANSGSITIGGELAGGSTDDRIKFTEVNSTDVNYVNLAGDLVGTVDIIGENINVRVYGVSNIEHVEFANGVVVKIQAGDDSPNELIGSDGIDVIFGNGGDDDIFGKAGNDTIYGGDGNDFINGGIGDDVIYGGDGQDWLEGWLGNDYLYGGAGNDVLLGGPGDDFLSGGDGDDNLDGGDGNDTIEGNAGDDTLDGGLGSDLLIGGAGDDLLFGTDSGSDIAIGGAGDDRILLSSGMVAWGDDDPSTPRGADTFRLASKAAVVDYTPMEGDRLEGVSFASWDAFLDAAEEATFANPTWDTGDRWGLLTEGSNGYESLAIWTSIDPGFQSSDGIVLGGTFLNGIDLDNLTPGRHAYDAFNVTRDTTTVVGSGGRDAFRSGFLSFDNYYGTLGNPINASTEVIDGGASGDLFDVGEIKADQIGGEGSDYFIIKGTGQILGGEGDDVFEARLGTSAIDGGVGDDSFIVTTGFEGRITGGQGADSFHFVLDNQLFDISAADFVSAPDSYGSSYITDFDVNADRITFESDTGTEVFDLSGYDLTQHFVLTTDSGYSLKNTPAGLTVTRGEIQDLSSPAYWQGLGAKVFQHDALNGGSIMDLANNGALAQSITAQTDTQNVLHLPGTSLGQAAFSTANQIHTIDRAELFTLLRQSYDLEAVYDELVLRTDNGEWMDANGTVAFDDFASLLKDITGISVEWLTLRHNLNYPIFRYRVDQGDSWEEIAVDDLFSFWASGGINDDLFEAIIPGNVRNEDSFYIKSGYAPGWSWGHKIRYESDFSDFIERKSGIITGGFADQDILDAYRAEDQHEIRIRQEIEQLELLSDTGVQVIPLKGIENLDVFLFGDGNTVTELQSTTASGTEQDDFLSATDIVPVFGDGLILRGLGGDDYIEASSAGAWYSIYGDDGDDVIVFVDALKNIRATGGDGYDTLILEGTDIDDLYVKGGGGRTYWEYGGTEYYLAHNTIERFITADGTSFSSFTMTENGSSDQGTLVGTDQSDTFNIELRPYLMTYAGGIGNDVYNIVGTYTYHDIWVSEAYNEGYDTVRVDTPTPVVYIAPNVEEFVLLGVSDTTIQQTYTLGNQRLIIRGNAGDNEINAGRGAVAIHGGDGDDTIHAEDGDDIVYGDDGNDIIILQGHSNFADGGAGDDSIDGSSGSGEFHGGYGNDTILATAENSMLRGGYGDDVLTGNGELFGGGGNDTLEGRDLGDLLDGGSGNDLITGLAGDDALIGGYGNDILFGGSGNDTLTGNTGDDQLIGGEGNDTFAFAGNWGHDQITGFGLVQSGHPNQSEVIDLSALSVSFADLTLQQSGSNTLVFVTADGAATNSIEIVGRAASEITESDFFFG